MEQLATIHENYDEAKIMADKKDKEIIDQAFKRIRNRNMTNTKEYTWELMRKEYHYHQKQNEKKKQNKKEKLSRLLDDTHDEMCPMGHCCWYNNKDNIKHHPCILCGSMKERKYCAACANDDKQKLGQDNYTSHIYCKHCRVRNAERIKKQIKMDTFKSEIIRNELIETPELQLDLLCNMHQKASVDTLIEDINKLINAKRCKWCLFVFRLDNLKIWKTCLGEVKTDLMIKTVANELKKCVEQINDGKWNTFNNGVLVQSFTFRIGGDKFCLAVKTGGAAYLRSLGPVYFSIKKNINKIGLKIKDLRCEKEEKEFKNAIDALDNLFPTGLCISTGLFLPYVSANNEKRKENWLDCAEKALQHANTLYPPMKNDIAIFYEKSGALIPDEKTLKCLETCVYDGL